VIDGSICGTVMIGDAVEIVDDVDVVTMVVEDFVGYFVPIWKKYLESKDDIEGKNEYHCARDGYFRSFTFLRLVFWRLFFRDVIF
jgi:hypothetical protein